MTQRREDAIAAAGLLFLRFGYRKTSMDDVARAAGVSRQALYLWFSSKRALFVAVVEHVMAKHERNTTAALQAEGPVAVRVLAAFDTLVGMTIDEGLNATAMDELMATASDMLGERVERHHQGFRDRLAGVLGPYASEGVSASDLANILDAASAGMKYQVPDRAAYLAGMEVAIRALLR